MYIFQRGIFASIQQSTQLTAKLWKSRKDGCLPALPHSSCALVTCRCSHPGSAGVWPPPLPPISPAIGVHCWLLVFLGRIWGLNYIIHMKPSLGCLTYFEVNKCIMTNAGLRIRNDEQRDWEAGSQRIFVCGSCDFCSRTKPKNQPKIIKLHGRAEHGRRHVHIKLPDQWLFCQTETIT